MKNFIVILLLTFLSEGVFGADEMKKEVTEGDSLTLPTALTETQSSNQILWLYGSDKTIIAKIEKGIYNTDDDDERFKGNLELDKQTGSLTIKNFRIINAGLYHLDINRKPSRKFSVTVYARLPTPEIDSPKCAQTPAGSSSPKCVFQCSVQTSDQVTLSWYKGNTLVSSNISNVCSRISLPLEVNYEDKTPYSCMVNNPISNKTQHLDITQLCHTCEDPGLSSGAIAGIIFVVVLLLLTILAGLIYYKHMISELQRLKDKIVSVNEGMCIRLKIDVEIQNDDLIELHFGELKAEIQVGTKGITATDCANETFVKRLILDKKSGSLIITDSKTTDSGVYTLKITSSSSSKIKSQKFNVFVSVPSISVMEGDDVDLKINAEMQKDSDIIWTFGDKTIAEIIETKETYDEGFKGRLKLDKTGSLTITNSRTTDSGDYKLRIKSSSGVSYKKFSVTVRERMKSVLEGDSVTLNTEIQRDDQIQLMFGDQNNLIAEMTGESKEITNDERFKGRLKLDKKTGSLTISNIKCEHSGFYEIKISGKRTTHKRFCVNVYAEVVIIKEGDDVTLNTGVTEKLRDEHIEWMFGDKNSVIAEMKESFQGIYLNSNLDLDKTGSLTIKNSRTTDSGDYKLRIKSSSGVSYKNFSVTVRERIVPVEGDSVTLYTDTEIQSDDLILWMFGDEHTLIAKMTGETIVSKYEYTNKLTLDKRTGSLTITDFEPEQTGLYILMTINSKGVKYKRFRLMRVYILNPKKVSVMEGEYLNLITDLNVERNEKVTWRFEEDSLAKGMCGDINATSYSDDEEFRGRVKLHHQTGDLTIRNTRPRDSGVYCVDVITSSGQTISSKICASVCGSDGKYPAEKLPGKVSESTVLLIAEDEQDGTSSF